jgi:hypothetical protein
MCIICIRNCRNPRDFVDSDSRLAYIHVDAIGSGQIGLSELPSQEDVVKAGKTDTVGEHFLEFTEAQTNSAG